MTGLESALPFFSKAVRYRVPGAIIQKAFPHIHKRCTAMKNVSAAMLVLKPVQRMPAP